MVTAAAKPAKARETPLGGLGTTGKSEGSHSAVLAAPETELILQILPLAGKQRQSSAREALAHAMTTAESATTLLRELSLLCLGTV